MPEHRRLLARWYVCVCRAPFGAPSMPRDFVLLALVYSALQQVSVTASCLGLSLLVAFIVWLWRSKLLIT